MLLDLNTINRILQNDKLILLSSTKFITKFASINFT